MSLLNIQKNKSFIKIFNLILLINLLRQAETRNFLGDGTNEQEYLQSVMSQLQDLKKSPEQSINYPARIFIADKKHSNNKPAQIFKGFHNSASNDNFFHTLKKPMDIDSQLEIINSEYLKNWNDQLGPGSPVMINQELPVPEGIENNLPVVGHPDQLYKYYVYSPMLSPNNHHHIKDEKKNQNADVLPMETQQPVVQESQKQFLMNPLFMAISSFLGMTVLFVIGILLMPRMFGDFKSRYTDDELDELTERVAEAIEAYNANNNLTRPKINYPESIIVGVQNKEMQRVSSKRQKKPKL